MLSEKLLICVLFFRIGVVDDFVRDGLVLAEKPIANLIGRARAAKFVDVTPVVILDEPPIRRALLADVLGQMLHQMLVDNLLEIQKRVSIAAFGAPETFVNNLARLAEFVESRGTPRNLSIASLGNSPFSSAVSRAKS